MHIYSDTLPTFLQRWRGKEPPPPPPSPRPDSRRARFATFSELVKLPQPKLTCLILTAVRVDFVYFFFSTQMDCRCALSERLARPRGKKTAKLRIATRWPITSKTCTDKAGVGGNVWSGREDPTGLLNLPAYQTRL